MHYEERKIMMMHKHMHMQHIHRKHDYIEMLHKLMDYVVISEDVFISFYFVFNANVWYFCSLFDSIAFSVMQIEFFCLGFLFFSAEQAVGDRAG